VESDTSSGIFVERCCRNSYGALCIKPYDPIKHVGEDVFIDPKDKKKWVKKQIDWFIIEVLHLY
jgi:hypothetical protein